MAIKSKIRTGDNVIVISGANKAATGKVQKITKDRQRVIVEGVNMIKKHTKPSATNPQGGIVEREASIHISNVALVTKDGKPTRVGYEMKDGKKVRVSRKTGEQL